MKNIPDTKIDIRKPRRLAFKKASAKTKATFLKQLDAAMKADHVTQTAVSRRVGVSQPRINVILKGKNDPRLSTLQKIAFGLGYKLELKLVKDESDFYWTDKAKDK